MTDYTRVISLSFKTYIVLITVTIDFVFLMHLIYPRVLWVENRTPEGNLTQEHSWELNKLIKQNQHYPTHYQYFSWTPQMVN